MVLLPASVLITLQLLLVIKFEAETPRQITTNNHKSSRQICNKGTVCMKCFNYSFFL